MVGLSWVNGLSMDHLWNIAIYVWLVVWNITVIFPYIWNFIIPCDEIIFFRGVGLNHQPGKSWKTRCETSKNAILGNIRIFKEFSAMTAAGPRGGSIVLEDQGKIPVKYDGIP